MSKKYENGIFTAESFELFEDHVIMLRNVTFKNGPLTGNFNLTGKTFENIMLSVDLKKNKIFIQHFDSEFEVVWTHSIDFL